MEDKFYNKLVLFLKLFNERPYHLAKYLIDKSIVTENFKNRLLNSDLEEMSNTKPFRDIKEMEDFYNSIISDNDQTIIEIEKSLNFKLGKLIEEEDYEGAADLRDYMIKKNIKLYL